MGKYYDWVLNHDDLTLTGIELKRVLNSLGFKYCVQVSELNYKTNIADRDEISEMVSEEWTGYCVPIAEIYMLLFKNENDAMIAKLKWT